MAHETGLNIPQGVLRRTFGISIPYIQKMMAEGCPFIRLNVAGRHTITFNTAEVYRWLEARTRLEAIKLAGGKKISTLESERARLTKIQADRVDMNMAIAAGDLVPAVLVSERWAARIVAFRAKMLAIPAKNAKLLAAADSHKEIFAILNDDIGEALDELVKDELEALDAEDREGDDSTDTAAAGSQAVLAVRRQRVTART